MYEYTPTAEQVFWARTMCGALRVGGHLIIPMTGDVWLKESSTSMLLVGGCPESDMAFVVACMFDAAGYSATLSRKEY